MTPEKQPKTIESGSNKLFPLDQQLIEAPNSLYADLFDTRYSQISIVIPTTDSDLVDLTHEGQTYTSIPLTTYLVGNKFYAQGWIKPETNQDFSVEDLSCHPQLQEDCYINIASPVIDEEAIKDLNQAVSLIQRPNDTLDIRIPLEKEIIDPIEFAKLYANTIETPNSGTFLSTALINKFFPEYIDQLGKQDMWRHQPAVLSTIGKALYGSDEHNYKGWVASPTGSGKTRIQAQLLETAISCEIEKPIYVTSRQALVEQTEESIEQLIPEISSTKYYGRAKNIQGDMIITTYDSLPKLLDKLREQGILPGMFVFDEAHNLLQRRSKILEHDLIKEAHAFAFTATPGIEHTLSDIGFDEIVQVPLSNLIHAGCIPPISVQRAILNLDQAIASFKQSLPDEREPYMKEKAELEERLTIETKIEVLGNKSIFHQEGTIHVRPTLLEANSIEEANKLMEELVRKYPDLSKRITVMTSEKTFEHNKQVRHKFNNGEIDILIGVNMISEGLNLPRAEVIIIKPWKNSQYRPFQDMGRVTRISPNGNPCLIVEIWPYEDSDQRGYRSALEIIGVRRLDPRIAFTDHTAATQGTNRVQRLFPLQETDSIEVPQSFSYAKLVEVSSKQPQRNRTITGQENETIALAIIQRYKQHINDEKQSLLNVRFYNNTGLKIEINRDLFKEMMGYRWSLLPYFRFDEFEQDALKSMLYDIEVQAELRLPLGYLSDPEEIPDFLEELSNLAWSNKFSREQLIDYIKNKFAIASEEYTLNKLTDQFAELEIISNDVLSYKQLIERLLLHGYFQSDDLPTSIKEITAFLTLDTSTATLMNKISSIFQLEVKSLVMKYIEELGGLEAAKMVISVANILRTKKDDLEILNATLNRIRKMSVALRFNRPYLVPSVKRRNLLHEFCEIYISSLNIPPEVRYENAETIEQLKELVVQRLTANSKQHTTSAIQIAKIIEISRTTETALGVNKRKLEFLIKGIDNNLNFLDFIGEVARRIDPEYNISYLYYMTNWQEPFSSEQLVGRLFESIISAVPDIDIPYLNGISGSSILSIVDRAGEFILPAMYVRIDRVTEERTRAQFRSYCERWGFDSAKIISDLKDLLRENIVKNL